MKRCQNNLLLPHQGLLIGDNDGGITLYGLRNFPEQPESADDRVRRPGTQILQAFIDSDQHFFELFPD